MDTTKIPIERALGLPIEIASEVNPVEVGKAAYFGDEEEGAIPNGTRVYKCNSEEGDSFVDGTPATVVTSIKIPEELASGSDFGYFIQYDNFPAPVFIMGAKIEVRDAEDH